jgi:uncharacterized membrane protein YidH (DUF202 family)
MVTAILAAISTGKKEMIMRKTRQMPVGTAAVLIGVGLGALVVIAVIVVLQHVRH